jgi:hypothetical protein
MRRAIGIAVLLLLSVSCTLGPDYKRPLIDTPLDFRDAETGSSLANVGWWELFEDPVLRELIEIALAENKDLLAAAWRVDEARAQLGFVKSEMWPSFGYSVSAQRISPSDELIGIPLDDSNQYAASAGVSWEIDHRMGETGAGRFAGVRGGAGLLPAPRSRRPTGDLGAYARRAARLDRIDPQPLRGRDHLRARRAPGGD